MSDNKPSRILSMFGHVADALQSANTKSIAQFTKDQRISPRVAVDVSLMNNPLLVDSLHSLNGIFSAYTMQAATRKLNVNNIHTNRVLHSLSTDRSKMGSGMIGVGTLGSIAASMEDFYGGLPDHGVAPMYTEAGFSMESAHGDDRRSGGLRARSGRNNADQISKSGNLSVGRVLTIDVSSGEHEAPMELLVQFQTQTAPAETIERILVTGVGQETAKQRWTRWMAGELDFWREVVLLDDVIKAEREIRRSDAAGNNMFKRILENRRKGGFLSLLSLNPHVNELSNVFVISQESFDRIQSKIGNVEYDQKRRDEMFERSGAIFLGVINSRYDTLRIFTHSLDGEMELTSRMVKQLGGKGEMDIMDVFKAFQSNSTPVF